MNMQKLKLVFFVAICFIGFKAKANTASFTFTTACQGTATQFTSTSTASVGNIILQEWDFDGDSVFDATGMAVSNIYSAAGSYQVTLQITTDMGFVGKTTNIVTVNPVPTVNFNFSGVCLGDPTSFEATGNISSGIISQYQWELNGNNDFNDATGQNVSFTFISPGYFNVYVRATSNLGCVAETTKVVTIAPKPSINFTASNVCENNEVEFINSSVALGSSINYTWNFEDGNTSTATEPTHTYAGNGTFNVKLIGQNSSGCSDSISRPVTVFPKPSAGFTTTEVCEGATTVFTNTSNYFGEGVQSNIWTFGDGKSLFDIRTQLDYTYATADTFNANLTVTTNNGCSDTVGADVIVNKKPSGFLTANGPLAFCFGESVDLTVNTTTGNNIVWSTGSVTNTITINQEGLYEVVLFTNKGCKISLEAEIEVFDLPILEISADTSINNGETATLQVEGAEFYEWENLASTDINYGNVVLVSPQETTTYEVTGISEYGCENNTSTTVTILDSYVIKPSNLFTPDGNGKNDFWYIENIDRYPDCEVQLFNAWGKLVYSQKAYNNTFDGVVNGKALPEGTYYYFISSEATDFKTNGSITLMRPN